MIYLLMCYVHIRGLLVLYQQRHSKLRANELYSINVDILCHPSEIFLMK